MIPVIFICFVLAACGHYEYVQTGTTKYPPVKRISVRMLPFDIAAFGDAVPKAGIEVGIIRTRSSNFRKALRRSRKYVARAGANAVYIKSIMIHVSSVLPRDIEVAAVHLGGD